jgi:hypothetical protein
MANPTSPRDQTLVIDNGQTTSNAIFIGNESLAGLEFPAVLTGANVSFTGCATETGTYKTVEYEGTDISFAVAASRILTFNPAKFFGVMWLKVVSDAAEGAERTITPLWRNLI